jgi:hypothetical protein
MLKLLLKLWADQKRRDFKWGRFLGMAYFFGLFMMVCIVVTLAIYEVSGPQAGMEVAVPLLAAMLIVPDFLHKLLMKHDETAMDHYLKSRPVSERAWNRFLLVSNVLNFWNWTLPLSLLPFCILFLPWPLVVPSMVLLLAVSLVGGVAITAFRKARGWSGVWPVLAAMALWAVVAGCYSLTVFLLPWWVHVVGFLLLCAGGVALFYDYLCDIRRYEESHEHSRRLFRVGSSSLFSMEYVSVLRSKRLRVAVLILPLVFVLNVYLQMSQGQNFMFYMMFLFSVFAPSMMLGQWVFGIEGNYFDGLWTKPVSIRQILENKFWFYALLDVWPTLLVLPVVWLGNVSPWLLVATWLFTTGIGNLSLMPTCLISSRIELFQSAFFNYQGASLAVNLYGLIIFVPLAIYGLCLWLLPEVGALVALSLLGLLGFALHRVVIEWLARLYEQRRYKSFERYRQ